MHDRALEIWVGAFVLAGFLALAYLAVRVAGFSFADEGAYRISARFDNVAGLRPRAKVSMAGVAIGRVTDIQVDTTYGEAVVFMDIDASAGALARDTGAQIVTEGIMGARYISLLPGGEEEVLQDGDQIHDTQGALVLENLIGEFVTRLGT